MVYEKGAGNYKDVTCPEGYRFDVPRTGRENQSLYSAIQAYRNATSPASSSTSIQSLSLGDQGKEKFASSLKPVLSRLTDALTDAFKNLKKRKDSDRKIQPRYVEEDNDDDDDDDEDEEDKRDAKANNDRKAQSVSDEQHHQQQQQQQQQTSGSSKATKIREVKAEPTIVTGADQLSGGGVIWIDISSWQTAGCWVPGGSNGLCPYQDPDNTVALQEIIKVSAIGNLFFFSLSLFFLFALLD
jgi:hypothetical protein